MREVHLVHCLVCSAWSLALVGCSDAPVPGPPDGNAGGSGVSLAASGASGAASSGAGTGGVLASTVGGAGSNQGGGGAAGLAGSGGVVAAVSVFVAQGHHGRITRSCDDGKTFPHDASLDDDYRCFVDAEHDCDHSAAAGRGLAFGLGSFVATWGWGKPGKLQQSTDGKQWSDVSSDTPTFADVAFGNGLFVACGNPTHISRDGVTWEVGGKLSFEFNYRGIEFVPAGGGTFVVSGESGEQRGISLSQDGEVWTAASERPAPCGEQLRGIAGSDTVIVLASAKGHVCRSTDAGRTFTHHPVSEHFTSPPLWTGSEFWLYEGATRWKSGDGELWSSEPITPPGIAIGALARSPAGTLLAANDGWQVWYEKQQLFRSSDGLAWEPLPPSAFTGSHPLNFVSHGYTSPTSGCGLP